MQCVGFSRSSLGCGCEASVRFDVTSRDVLALESSDARLRTIQTSGTYCKGRSQLDFCPFSSLYAAGARAYISMALIGRDSFEKTR